MAQLNAPVEIGLTTLNLEILNPVEVLQRYDVVKLYRSTSGEAGPFIEITAPAQRQAIQTARTEYEFVDPQGSRDYWYRTAYFSTQTGDESEQSDPVPGTPDPALEILSVEELKNIYLFGIDLTNDRGEPYPDILFEFYIKAAVQFVETKLDLNLIRREIINEVQDFHRPDYYSHIFIDLDQVPVIQVNRVDLILPTNQPVIQFRPEWLQVDKNAGYLNVIPGNTEAATVVLGAAGNWLTFISNTKKHIPDVFHIDYTVGFEKGVPADLRDVVGMQASYGPLGIAGDLLGGAGIASQSISLDGLSQSFNTTSSATNAGYGARIKQYQAQLKDSWATLRRNYHPIGMAVV